MSDKYRIDSHKLIYHPDRVSIWKESFDDWEKAKSVYPIYVEVSPIGLCNHRCKFCGLDFMGYKNLSIPPETLIKTIAEMKSLGVKSLMFAGEGEPLLYKKLPDILDFCSQVNMDCSLTTNLVPVTQSNAESLVKNAKWIKVSINAGNPSVYADIHGTKESDFDLVVKNMNLLSQIKKDKGYTCTLGAQIILLPENYDTVTELASITKCSGFDYLVVKPYSQHLLSITDKYKDIDYSKYLTLDNELSQYNTDGFNVIFRSNTMEKYTEQDHGYTRCYSTPFFWAYISSDGSIYGCSCYLGNDKFCYGNINNSSFKQIWESELRKTGYEYVKNVLNVKNCRINCRMDEINRYLRDLKNPHPHVNFI